MQIEEGKFYQLRNGLKIGPMERFPGATHYFWCARLPGEHSRRTFKDNGRYRDDMPCDLDIVAEWREHASVTLCYLESAGEDPEATPEAEIIAMLDTVADANYSALAGVLREAHAHAAKGKGVERHGNGRGFNEQPIMEIPRLLGGSPEGQLYQIMKKAQEANGMVKRGEREAAIRELLGAINYAAAAVLTIREAA